MRILLLFLCINVLSFGQDLTCFSEKGKYGFKRGNTVVIQPQYEYADHFHEGRAAVQINRKWGFIDETGKMVIEPVYKKVESFNRGFAKFYENQSAGETGELFGLLDQTGRKVIGPVCLSGEWNRNCYVYRVKNKYGFISADGKMVVEPLYKEIGVAEYFAEGIKYDESVDVYTVAGELIAASASEPSMILWNNLNSKVVDVQWSQETRILDETGKQVGPTYTDIQKIECVLYSSTGLGGYEYYYHNLYVLNIPMKNSESNSDVFHIMLENGIVYNDTEYFNLVSDENRTIVERNGLPYELNNAGELVPTKYRKIEKLLDYEVLTLTNNTTRIIELGDSDVDTLVIGTFAAVQLLLLDEPRYKGDENMDTDDQMYRVILPLYQNVVEVEGLNENKGKFALFSLWNKALVTPYGSSHFSLLFCDDLNGDYVYKNEQGIIGATFDRNQVFAPKYSSFQHYDYLGFEFRDTLDHQSFYSDFGKMMIDISDSISAFWSLEYFDAAQSLEYDEETGETYYSYPERRFTDNFMLLRTDGDFPKFGFIDGKGKVVFPQFDSIDDGTKNGFYNPDFPILYTYLDGKYGAYDFYNSAQVPPVYDVPLQFSYSDLVNEWVCPFIEKGYLLTTNNKKMYSEVVEPFLEKRGKFYGVRDYNNFSEGDSAVTIIPFLYKEIKEDFGEKIAIAKGQNNKWGILSLLTEDTLVPFEYSNIERTEEYYSISETGDGATWFKLFKGKKVGVYVPRFKRFLPAVYDKIEMDEVESAFGTTIALFVHSGEKTGLYNDELKELFPCEYDGILVQSIQEKLMCFAQKGDKYYAYPYFDGFSSDNPRYQYDLILESQGLRKTEKGYDCFSAGYSEFTHNVTDSLSFESEGLASIYIPFIQNGLLGLKSSETGKILLEPGKKMIEFMDEYYLLEFKNGETYYRNLDAPKKRYKFQQY